MVGIFGLWSACLYMVVVFLRLSIHMYILVMLLCFSSYLPPISLIKSIKSTSRDFSAAQGGGGGGATLRRKNESHYCYIAFSAAALLILLRL